MRDEGMSVDPPAARSDHLSGATGWALHRPLDHDECRHREPAADLVFQGPIEFGLAGTTTPHGAVTNAFRARDIGQFMLLDAAISPKATLTANGSVPGSLLAVGAARPVVCSHGELLALSPQLAVDLRESIALARALFRPGMAAEFDAEAVIRMLSTELLPGWYDDSVLLEAERWRQLRLHSLEAL